MVNNTIPHISAFATFTGNTQGLTWLVELNMEVLKSKEPANIRIKTKRLILIYITRH